MLIVAVCFGAALFFRFRAIPSTQLDMYFEPLTRSIVPIALLYAGANLLARLDEQIWRYASVQEVISLWMTTTACTLFTIIVDVGIGMTRTRPLPLSVVLLGGILTFFAFVSARYRGRLITGVVWRLDALRGKFPPAQVRTLIYGAGDAGQVLARQLRTKTGIESYVICGFVDDDLMKRGRRIQGIKVLGDRQTIANLVDRERVDLIILAMPSIRRSELSDILSQCQKTRARIQVAPDIMGFIAARKPEPLLREVGIEDLLGRSPIPMDHAAASGIITGKIVLLTGACGSIGSELCRQVAALAPRRLVVVDNNETGIYDLEIEMRTRFPAVDITSVIADATDGHKIEQVFREFAPHVVFHAAAYKHVPLMERYPEEAVRVNVGGTRVVVDLAQRYDAERVVLVSTDKAVNPCSVMGATKRVAEMLVATAGQAHAVNMPGTVTRRTLCTAVRFGNVLGSRGSVIPTFARQIELGGPVTVTHPDMTRYFMEIPEAASLIIQAASLTEGDDIFILDMCDPIQIDDLARKMIRMRGLRPDVDIPIVYTGIRPGEKLHEELAYAAELKQATAHPRIYRHSGGQYQDAASTDAAVDRLLSLAAPESRTQLVAALFDLARADQASSGALEQRFGLQSPVLSN